MLKEEIFSRVLDALEAILDGDARLTKSSLAKELGWSATKFSELLGGRMKPGVDLISNLVTKRKVSSEWILTGEGGMFDGRNAGIPLIPTEAVAGYGTPNYELPIENYYAVPEFERADFLIRVKGDSMAPKYMSGDVVACKTIEAVNFWQWHAIYVIATRNQGVLIKRVEPGTEPDCITCVSENPVYRPFSVPKEEIISVASVLGAIVFE